MWYTVVDDAGEIYYYTNEADSPDLEHHIEKHEHIGAHIVEYPELWNVLLFDAGEMTQWSTHASAEEAIIELGYHENGYIEKA